MTATATRWAWAWALGAMWGLGTASAADAHEHTTDKGQGRAERAASGRDGTAKEARARVQDADGRELGTVTFIETPNGVLLRGELQGLQSGTRAMHLHEVGRCEGPDFKTAGEHFAPRGRQHGFKAQGGAHAGDLPNLEVPEGGRVRFEVLARDVTLKAGRASLLDRDGTSIVIHERADDHRSQPSGDAGGRVACGVVEREPRE
jgi:Cu-Zn family superoxide dismutase